MLLQFHSMKEPSSNYDIWVQVDWAGLTTSFRVHVNIVSLLTYLLTGSLQCRVWFGFLHIFYFRVRVGLPVRHVEKPDSLDLFPSSVRQPKIDDLDLYTYVYICISISVSGSSWNFFQPDKSPQNRTPGNPRFRFGLVLAKTWVLFQFVFAGFGFFPISKFNIRLPLGHFWNGGPEPKLQPHQKCHWLYAVWAIRNTMQINSRPTEIINLYSWQHNDDLPGWWVWLIRVRLELGGLGLGWFRVR